MKNGKSQKDEKDEKFGQDFGLVSQAVVTGRKVGADRDFWKILAHDINEFSRIVKQAKEALTFRFPTDYSNSDFQTLLEKGNYEFCNSSVSLKNFSVRNRSPIATEVEFKLFRFAEEKSPFWFNSWLKGKRNLGGPADIIDLLLLGAEKPELQISFPIVASGSMCGRNWIPCLSVRSGEERIIAMAPFRGNQPIATRFLSVFYID